MDAVPQDSDKQVTKTSFWTRFKSPKVTISTVLVLIIVLGLVIAVSLFKQSSKTNKNLPNVTTGCPKDLSGVFAKSFIDPVKILTIRPLGFTDGMEHMLPVDHTNFVLNAAADEKVPVYAPTQISITQIAKHTDYRVNGTPFTKESNYMFEFTICQSALTGWSEFIHQLSPDLQTIWDQVKKTHDEGPLNQGARAINDTATVSITVRAGQLIGYTGVDPSFAFSIYDTRSKPSGVDVSYYGDHPRIVNAICFTDLYTGDLKKTLTDKYGYYNSSEDASTRFTPRSIEPKCGQVIQNLNGTVQGDWFAKHPARDENLEAEGKTVSFIHNNYDPLITEISIGGNIVPKPQTFSFKPETAGGVNREFSATKTNETYCFKDDPVIPAFIFAPTNHDSRVLARLLDEHHLKIEVQTGDCSGAYDFVNAFTYER